MDLHKALNRLATDCAEEILAGAHVFGLHAEDHAAVESFMRGLNETRGLKFNHPGLETMATRSGGRLVIQNDIGTTDAHVLVIAVDQNAVTVTYTDVHRARAKFFIALFENFQAQWSGLDRHTAAGLGEDNAFFLVTGRYQADSAGDRDAFLAAVGAAPGVPDRLEQGAQAVAQLGRQGRCHADSRMGRLAALWSPRLP